MLAIVVQCMSSSFVRQWYILNATACCARLQRTGKVKILSSIGKFKIQHFIQNRSDIVSALKKTHQRGK